MFILWVLLSNSVKAHAKVKSKIFWKFIEVGIQSLALVWWWGIFYWNFTIIVTSWSWISTCWSFFLIFNKSARTIFLSKYVFPTKCENHSRRKRKKHIRGIKFCSEKHFLDATAASYQTIHWASDSLFQIPTYLFTYNACGTNYLSNLQPILICKQAVIAVPLLQVFLSCILFWWESLQTTHKQEL